MLAVTSGAFVELFVHPDATEITKTMKKMFTLLSLSDVIVSLLVRPTAPRSAIPQYAIGWNELAGQV
jgi:hypothetical protein